MFYLFLYFMHIAIAMNVFLRITPQSNRFLGGNYHKPGVENPGL